VEFQQDSQQAQLSRLLVAADASVDPHRLMKFCCERAGDDGRSGGFDALFVCATHEDASSPVLELAARLARVHGLTVIASTPDAGSGSWVRRLVDPLLHRLRN
jgi:hypothetical protein